MLSVSIRAFILPLLFLLLKATPAVCNPETDSAFTIRGYLAGHDQADMIYLRYTNHNQQHYDSVLLKDGHFEFSGFVNEPVWAELSCGTDEQSGSFVPPLQFYLEPVTVLITGFGPLQEAIIQGGHTEAERQLWEKVSEPLIKQRGVLMSRKYLSRDNEDSVIVLTKAMAQVQQSLTKLQVQFVARFPDSYMSWELVKGNSYAIDPDVLGPMLQSLNPTFTHSPEAKGMAERLAIARRTWIGKPALEFTQADVNGNPVSLSSFRGKYVLVDFWASWCGWCRLENPNLIKAYHQYKGKGFTVLGVSLDDAKDKDKWLAAIQKDGLPWQQVCDLKGRDNAVAKLYGIKGIPQNVLINPRGIIVAKNLRGDDLLVKLHELLNN